MVDGPLSYYMGHYHVIWVINMVDGPLSCYMGHYRVILTIAIIVLYGPLSCYIGHYHVRWTIIMLTDASLCQFSVDMMYGGFLL